MVLPGAVLAFLPLLLPLCASAANGQAPDTETLSVEVRSDGRPLAGAAVRVAGGQGTTNAAGRASLAVAPGEYEVTVEASGFLPAVVRASVASGVVTQVKVELEPLPVSYTHLTLPTNREV